MICNQLIIVCVFVCVCVFRTLDLGFEKDLTVILNSLNSTGPSRQNVLLSATLTHGKYTLCFTFYVFISLLLPAVYRVMQLQSSFTLFYLITSQY